MMTVPRPPNTFFTTLGWLAIFLGKITLWFVLVGGIAHGLAKLEMVHYRPDDTPDRRFVVVVQDGEPRPIYWHEYDAKSHTLSTMPTDASHTEDYLSQDKQGNLVYHNEGALWHSKSIYRIDRGKAVPIAYLFFTFGHVFYGIIGASLVLMVISYAQRRLSYCHQPDELANYHHRL